MKKIEITSKEMLEALNRSGYLLESEITSILASSGFFVESNQVIVDPITGKSREIDLLAEYYDFQNSASDLKISTRIKYVFEIKNNLFPITLLTKLEFSPNIEPYDGFKQILTLVEGIDISRYEGYTERLLKENEGLIYTQYCSFHKKKENEELMALHPDNIHSGLMKITQYCEEQAEMDDNDDHDYKDEYFRHFLYLPILLIKDDLFELEIDSSNTAQMKQVNYSKLLFNYHYKDKPKMAVIYVVTKQGFPSLMKKLATVEKEVLDEMIKLKKDVA